MRVATLRSIMPARLGDRIEYMSIRDFGKRRDIDGGVKPIITVGKGYWYAWHLRYFDYGQQGRAGLPIAEGTIAI